MTGAPDELVLAEHRGPVLVLTFNRPAKLNAWTDELGVRAGVAGADFVEGVASHLDKRTPSFPSLPVRS
ncbi:hypothetical protein J7E87_01235 [Streptomyces sp. ISL-1]|uniref:hypothetical protein n=1 Tax=Streptomyces sp. ISL-1 TaxID=2817657 RepID=UPI001BE84D5E|nr:hypothetical protein [Streptomyces sp. ISL-1]MBT2388073.1 hypothetical protein [Streptomyces sp. ISL-1]